MVLDLTDLTWHDVIKNNRHVLVDVWTEWCGPCKMMSPIVEELADDNPGLVVGKVDADQHAEMVQQFAIKSVPTLLFFRDSELVDRHVGTATKHKLQHKVEQLVREH